VHGPIGEELEDRGTHVTAPAAPAATGSAAATATTGAETEAGTEATGAETAEARAAETCVTAVVADVVTELATGLPTLFVQRTTVLRAEGGSKAEAETAALEGAFWRCEWGVHSSCLSFDRKHALRFRYVDDISETIAMQRRF